MPTVQNNYSKLKGAEWLIKEAPISESFAPEDFDEEQNMIKETCIQFINQEVLPVYDKIEKKEPGFLLQLMEQAGQLGLLGISVPEEYGGLGKDFKTSTVVSSFFGGGFSFSVACSAHSGIGTLPILYFGTEEQKKKYIPKLATGEWKGAYGLTEPGSGSDALGAKTTATLSSDGKHYLLNGQKIWITNGGFANVFTVFAKVNGEAFTAFIVERGFEGFSNGPEEHKMGIQGSSTVQLYFQDCKVPVENVLGEIGKGHLIAFNILNIGRLKLAANTLDASKRTLKDAAEYAINRQQFKTPIAQFGAIQYKLAEMAIRIWICETGVFRVSNLINMQEQEHLQKGEDFQKAVLSAAEEYAVECAILKVYGSEMLDYVVDEALQIHGGNGFSEEYTISRAYRDSRINRIYEGTNEINRLLILDMTLKRAMKGRLNLMEPAMAVAKELMSIPSMNENDEGFLMKEKKYIANFKKAILMIAGAAVQKLNKQLDTEQEILMNLSDMAIETFHAESALLRVMKLYQKNPQAAENSIQTHIVKTFIYDAAAHIHKYGTDAIASFAEGDEQRMMLLGLKRYTKTEVWNVKNARRKIAQSVIENYETLVQSFFEKI